MKLLAALLLLAVAASASAQIMGMGSRKVFHSVGKTISFVQFAQGVNNFGGTTSASTFGASTAVGDNILVCAVWDGSNTGVSLISVTDTQGASYTVDSSTLSHTGGSSYPEMGEECAHSTTPSSAAADTVTCTISAANYLFCSLVEVNPGGGTISLDTAATNVGTATYSPTSGTATPTQAGEFAFSGIDVGDNEGSGGITAGAGWTIVDSSGGGYASEATEYRALSSTAAVSATYSLTSESINYAANVAVYRSN